MRPLKAVVRVQVRVPAGLRFRDLQLRMEADGNLSYDTAVMDRVLAESGVRPEWVTDDILSAVIGGWYEMHRESGGESDPVVDQMLREVIAEKVRNRN